MRRIAIDKSSIPFLAIAAIFAATAFFLFFSLRSDAVDQAIKSDRILNIGVMVEREGKPVSTQLFMFYPANARGAVLDIPSETGLIIKSLNRVDRIDALYSSRRPAAYLRELSSLLDAEVGNWIILDEVSLAGLVDLLEGIEVFIPAPVDLPGPPRAILPSGALILDGDKANQFAFYADPEETDADAAARRQRLFQSLVRRIGEKAAWLGKAEVFPTFRRTLETNLSADSLRALLPEFAKLDADRLVLQRVTGAYRTVDGKRLLFPHYDGELVRDIVKQTLNALASAPTSSPAEKTFTLEVLNGTAKKGLAKSAADIFQSFGYDVVSIGNADRDDYDRTAVLDRFSNPEGARNIADVIRCENVSARQPETDAQAVADFTIVLGKDFNGRYCAP